MQPEDDENDGVTLVGPGAFAGAAVGPILVVLGALAGWRLSGWAAAVSWIGFALALVWMTSGALKLLAVWRLFRFLKKNDYLE